jgi:cytochrome c553
MLMIRKFPVGFLIFCLVCISASYTTALADTGAELFQKLTCHSCHGLEGRGMVRTETKENYRLSKKVFKQLYKSGIPKSILKQMKPMYKKKFDNRKTFVTGLKEALAQEAYKKYSSAILEQGGKVYYRKGDVMKGFENYPRLTGNKEIYLYNQMRDILEGRRINGSSDAMRGIQPFLVANKITDKDYRLIAHYLSKIKRK